MKIAFKVDPKGQSQNFARNREEVDMGCRVIDFNSHRDYDHHNPKEECV